MDFEKKQYDGSYEVSGIEIEIEGQLLRGVLYIPAHPFNKPFPIVIYFHDFPQLFSLKEIVKNYEYLLKLGFSFLVFNFRGYRYSEGQISLESQLLDSLKIIELIQLMGKKGFFKMQEINILAHGFGGYMALLLCSQVSLINKVLLLSPILDLEKHVNNESFFKSLAYLNQFLPGMVRGIENVPAFIDKTKSELKDQKYNIKNVLSKIRFNKLKIIIGDLDKITPIDEIEQLKLKEFYKANVAVISGMDHDCLEEHHYEKINNEIKMFFQPKNDRKVIKENQ